MLRRNINLHRFCRGVAAAIVLLCIASGNLIAQNSTGTIRGTVSGGGGAPLGDQTTRHELPDQAADGAPGETRPPDEGGSRHRTGRMQLADDRAQVRPADGFAPESRFVANGGHGDLCSS